MCKEDRRRCGIGEVPGLAKLRKQVSTGRFVRVFPMDARSVWRLGHLPASGGLQKEKILQLGHGVCRAIGQTRCGLMGQVAASQRNSKAVEAG